PDKEVVFFAVGFETTAPANALSVVHAQMQGLTNYAILTSHVLVPPAMELIMQDTECIVDGFLGAGHVCTIMGIEEYEPLVQQYKIPIVITGFEPVDLLEGILMVVQQLEKGEYKLENQYSRVVKAEGNRDAQMMMKKVFHTSDREWRGIGNIPHSGYEVREAYKAYDANVKFDLQLHTNPIQDSCLSGDIMKGKIKPYQCPYFGKKCTPSNPLGAPMVSSEGACAAYYHYNVE
ncbi:MAG: hydrogenase formation protein HypD, partial [Anaerovoracaceae bacterium]